MIIIVQWSTRLNESQVECSSASTPYKSNNSLIKVSEGKQQVKTHLKMKMKRMRRAKNMATLSIVRNMTTSW